MATLDEPRKVFTAATKTTITKIGGLPAHIELEAGESLYLKPMEMVRLPNGLLVTPTLEWSEN